MDILPLFPLFFFLSSLPLFAVLLLFPLLSILSPSLPQSCLITFRRKSQVFCLFPGLFNLLTAPTKTTTKRLVIIDTDIFPIHPKGVIHMQIRCSKEALAKGVNIVSKAVPTRTTMAILECLLIDATLGEIKLADNDMEIGIETVIKGEIVSKGMIALDARIFSEIVRKLPDGEVDICVEENLVATIRCNKANFKIMGKEGEEFSSLPYVEKKNSIVISAFTLKEIIRQTIFSISDTDSNKMMTGELFEIEENRLRVISLDGHRISIRRTMLKDNYAPKKVVVPGKALLEISKILSGETDDLVEVFFTDNHILFEFDETKVVSRLIDGEYFHVDQMLSSDYETKVKVKRKELLSCLDRATLLVKEGDKQPIGINIKDENMELKVNSFLGSMNEDIAVEKEGKDILIGFNPRFLMEALRAIDEEEVCLYMVNAKAPCFIKDEEKGYIYLILPVNFNTAAV